MTIQHLRSSTANKRPTASAMSDGQIAINTNASNSGLFFKDADGDIRKVGPVFVGTTAPNSSPATGGSTGHAIGEQWLDSSGGVYQLKIWDGTAWRNESVLIGTSRISDDAVTADKLADTAVTAGSYTAADITVDAQGRITAAASGTIGTSEIADGAVTSAKLENDITIAGNLTVNGTTTTVNSTTLTVDDKNIELGSVSTPSDTTADGGGITLKGATDKTIKWVNSTGCWTFDQPVEVASNIAINGGELGSRTLQLQDSNTDDAMIYGDNSGSLSIQGGASQPGAGITVSGRSASSDPATIKFYTEDVSNSLSSFERCRIDSNGIIEIGKATGAANSGTGLLMYPTSAPFYAANKSASGNHNGIVFYHGSTYVGGLNYSNSATTLVASSDYRLKENITAIPNAISRAKQLNPVQFNFISEPGETTDGFLAHEVGEVVPLACFGEKDAVDENGDIKPQSLSQVSLIPLLTAALKEAIIKIETLEAKVAALEAG